MTSAEYDYAYSYPYGHYGHPDEGYEKTYYDENDGCFHYELCIGSIIEPDPHITHRILLLCLLCRTFVLFGVNMLGSELSPIPANQGLFLCVISHGHSDVFTSSLQDCRWLLSWCFHLRVLLQFLH